MRREINRFVLLIVNTLDDVRLFAHSGVGKHGVSGSQIFQIALERTDVAGGPMRNVLSNSKIIRDFLYRIESGELANAHAHGVARMDQAIGARHNAAISAVGVSGRPVAGAVNFTGLNWAIANRRTRQQSMTKSNRVNKRLERRADLPIRRSQRPIEFAVRVITAAHERADPPT